MPPFDTSVIARARRRLSRCPGLHYTTSRLTLDIPAPSDEGFPVRLRVGARRCSVHLAGWYRHFDRDDDALDCLEFALSASCRLRIELRGPVAVAWTVEARQYGQWEPRHRVARRIAPFWLPRRVEYRQNSVSFVSWEALNNREETDHV